MKGNKFSFELNYLRLNQFRADKIEAKIERYESLHDELVFFKQQIAEIKDDAGSNGLDHADRVAIHQYLDNIGETLGELEKLPDLATMTHRLENIENKIERHAEMWGIDSW